MTLADLRRRLPPRTLAYLAVGALVVAGFVLVFLIPEYREADRLRREIAAIRESIEAQQRLMPVRESLRRIEGQLPSVGPVGGQERLPLSDVARLTDIFDSLAQPTGLRVTQVSPDPASVTRDGLLAVRLNLTGQADAFREFLLALGRYGPLAKVESVGSLMGRDGREFSVKCWLAVR